jgi:hypothetical protein
MAQGNFTDGKTSLLVSDFIDRLKAEDSAYFKTGTDFITPFQIVLPSYAADYSGSYYRKKSQTSAPTSFSTEQKATSYGNFYEEPVPADCQDNGVESLHIFYDTNSVVAPENTVNSEDEQAWNLTENKVYWRQSGRYLRVFIPYQIASSGSLAYTIGSFKRLPTYPQSESDYIDAPAEDVETLFNSYKASVIKL